MWKHLFVRAVVCSIALLGLSLTTSREISAASLRQLEAGIYSLTGASQDLVLNDYSRGGHSIGEFAQERGACSATNANFFGGGIALGIYGSRYEAAQSQPSSGIVRRALVLADSGSLPEKFILARNPANPRMLLLDISQDAGFNQAEFAKLTNVTFGVSGLRLIHSGQAESSEARASTYTIMGWNQAGEMMLMVFRGLSFQTIKTKALAAGMVEGVGLDGGGSTQMYSSSGGFDLSDPYRESSASTEQVFVPVGGDGSARSVPFYVGFNCNSPGTPAPTPTPTEPPPIDTPPVTPPEPTPTEVPPPGMQTQDIRYNLNAGWNAINLPGRLVIGNQTNPTTEVLLTELAKKELQVRYVGTLSAGNYQILVWGEGGVYGNPEKLRPNMGVLIFLDKSANVTLSLEMDDTPRPTKLLKGWNLAGVSAPGQGETSASLVTKAQAQGIEVKSLSHLSGGTFENFVIEDGTGFGRAFPINRREGYYWLVLEQGQGEYKP